MTTTTATQLSTERRLTIVKHLAGGKDLDTTAEIVRLDRRTVLEVASHHGFPSTELLTRAVALLEKKIERDAAPTEHPQAAQIARSESSAPRIDRAPTAPQAEPTLTRPDEIRVLINTAKGHPSKRIQAAGDRVIDAVDRLKGLIREDQEKHAEKRRQDAERIAARAEVERLSKALADAKAKLRGSKPTGSPTPDSGASASDIRAWARSSGVECPSVGRVPSTVRAAYDEAHREAS